MGIYNVHAGHCPQGKGAYGAVGILKESVEDRLVKNEIIYLLKEKGHTVYDCTVEEAVSAKECLSEIVKKCNQRKVDLDISIHLNSGRNDYSGDGQTGGTEVYNFSQQTQAVSDRICRNISSQLNIRNRGTKYSTNLYVLRNTKSPSILVECCFVDDKDDTDRWNYKQCAKAIVDGILGDSSQPGTSPSPLPDPAPSLNPQPSNGYIVDVDGFWGTGTTKATQKMFSSDIDGVVSRQSIKNKKYLKNATSGWKFYSNYEEFKKGSLMIKKLQLYIGMSGKDVDGIAGKTTIVSLQRFLINKGYSVGSYGADGYMGADTVKAWQRYINMINK